MKVTAIMKAATLSAVCGSRLEATVETPCEMPTEAARAMEATAAARAAARFYRAEMLFVAGVHPEVEGRAFHLGRRDFQGPRQVGLEERIVGQAIDRPRPAVAEVEKRFQGRRREERA